MEEIEKLLKYSKLFNLYSPLLSSAQKEILHDYYFLDLSISEISENRSISRSAVEDALKKGKTKLDEFEEKLHLLEKNQKVVQKAKEIGDLTENSEVNKKIEEILEELDNGVWELDRKTIKNI